jgi:hypothetical protein
MEATFSSETSVDSRQSTRRWIPEDSSPHNHRCENLKSYIQLKIKSNKLSQDTEISDRELNPENPEYGTELLISRGDA